MNDKTEQPAGASPQRTTFGSLIDAAFEAVSVLDNEGNIVEWNEEAEHLFGWSRDEALGRCMAEDLIARDDRPAFWESLALALGKRDDAAVRQQFTLSGLRRGKHNFPLELSMSFLIRSGQQQCVVFLRDLSERKRNEQRLARHTLESRLLYQATTLAAADHSFEEALENCVRIIGETTGWPIGHVYMPDQTGEHLISTNIWYLEDDQRYGELRRTTSRTTFAYGEGLPGRIWKLGEPAWVADIEEDAQFRRAESARLAKIRGAFGFPVKTRDEIVAVFEFFTTRKVEPDPQLLLLVRSIGNQLGLLIERKRFEADRARLAAIVESSGDAIIGKSLSGNITSWNAGARRVYGYTAEEAIGRPISILNPPGLEDEEPEILDVITRGKRLEEFETIRRRKDGRLIEVSITVSPIFSSDGAIIGSATIERDVTVRKQFERELHLAKEAAEAANQAKSEFLANISHELRTPMNAIIGMTDLALEEELPAVALDYLETVRDSADTLLHLLNDLLDFSRLEAGKFDLEPAPFSLRQTLDDSMKTLSLRAYEKGLELGCDVHRDVPDWLEGDSHRLRQVIMNLAGNAVKFTQQGEVVVQVEVESRQDDEICLHFTVSDTGIGISEEDQSKIFAPFEQADASTTRKFSGSGLGLAICRELVGLMGGRIWLESNVGEGSRFHCTMRFGLPDKPSPSSDPALVDEIRGLPVLIVDDNATNRHILKNMVSNWSMQPTVVADGQSALAHLQQTVEEGGVYPLVLVDALMPEMDGFTLIRRMREDARLRSATILMLSSADRQAFEDRCRELDVASYLVKPVSQSDLLDAMMTALKGPPLERKQTALLQSTTHPLSVLLAEDTPANQKVIRAILDKRGHRVEVANNGREAIDLMWENDFDVVLMDVQMPTMDGLQATEAIREMDDHRKAEIPIVAMTAHAMRGDREKCLKAGMNGYIAKPINAGQLISLIENLAASRQPEPAEHKPQPASGQDAQAADDAIRVINQDAALARLGGDESLLRDFVGFFFEDYPGLMEEIQAGLQAENAHQVARAAHTLKGLASNFDAHAAVEAALAVEQQGKAENLSAAGELLPRLKQEFRRVADALRALES